MNDKSTTFFPTRNGKKTYYRIRLKSVSFLFVIFYNEIQNLIYFLKSENDFLLEVCSEIINLIIILAFSCLPQREIAFLFHAHLGFYNWQ